MKAAIAIDDWKLPVFRRILEAAGFKYEDAGAFGGPHTMLTVETDEIKRLSSVLEECHRECERKRPRRRFN